MDRMEDFRMKCNLGTIGLERIDSAEEEQFVKDLITRHHQYTVCALQSACLATG